MSTDSRDYMNPRSSTDTVEGDSRRFLRLASETVGIAREPRVTMRDTLIG